MVRADVNRHVETGRIRTCSAWHGRHRRQQSSSWSTNIGLDGVEGGNGRLFFFILFSSPLLIFQTGTDGIGRLDDPGGRPVGQLNCSETSRHPRSNVPSLRPYPVEIHLCNNCTQRCEKKRRRRTRRTLVGSTCESCKVPNKQPAACKVRQNANSVMCWRAMNPKRATWAVDLGGRSSTAKLA